MTLGLSFWHTIRNCSQEQWVRWWGGLYKAVVVVVGWHVHKL
jgi:hypothetical protein